MQQDGMQRRDFVRGLAAATVGVMASRVSAEDAPAETLYGQGAYRYRHVKGWGVLGADTPVKDCHGMVQAKDGRIFLLNNHTANNVIIYSREGALLGKWGTAFPGAHGLTLCTENGEERLFITDHDRHQVYKTTLDGEILLTLDWPEQSGKYQNAGQYKPTHVAVAPDGSFYVSDGYGQNFVMHYDPKGALIKTFGGGGNAPGALHCAHGAHVDLRDPAHPVLLITSRSQNAIKRFTLAGDHLDTIALPGAMPCFMVPHGEYLIVPHLKGGSKPAGSGTENGFVSILDRQNKIVSNVAADAAAYGADGVPAKMAANCTLFTYPHGLLVDDRDSLYIAQWNSGRTYPIKLERVPA